MAFTAHWGRAVVVCCVAAWLMGASGCYTETVVLKRPFEDLRGLADDKPGDPSRARDRAIAPRGWAVQLQSFSGPDRLKEAYAAAVDIRETGQLADVWFADDGNASYVYVGRFTQRDSKMARRVLKDARAVKLDGNRLFRGAELQPIVGARGDDDDDMNLANHSGMMTLLVAIFEVDYNDNPRLAAEEYAQKLQSDGESLAFYYHGQHQSLVTVGLFTRNDFVIVNGLDSYGPTIREVQSRFPHVLKNNAYVPRVERNAPPGSMQPTTIVKVP